MRICTQNVPKNVHQVEFYVLRTHFCLQRSVSFKVPLSPANKVNVTPYKAPQPSPAKRRLSRTWSDMMTTVGNVPTDLLFQM
jgi:hypothetical protein